MSYKYSYDSEEVQYKPAKLKTDRKMWKLVLFGILTLGIYSIVFFMPLSFDVDKVSPKGDRSKTMSYLAAFVLSMFTANIVMDVWQYQITERISEALEARDVDYDFGTGDFWGWFIFGSLVFIGPFVYFHKLCKAMNLLCEDYNKSLEKNK